MANSNKHCADFFTKGGHSCKFILSTATGGHSPMHKRYRYDMSVAYCTTPYTANKVLRVIGSLAA